MKKSKRILVLILTLVMSLSFNVALAGDDVPVIGWEKPEETLKFTAYMGQGDPQSDIDTQEESGYRMKNWLKEEMNVEIELQRFMDAQEQRISLMMLDGSYPELLAFTNEAASAMFIESGHALDLAPLLEQYDQNILAEIGDYIELFKDEEGHIYRLPSHWGYKVDSTIAEAFAVRYDWWLELDTELYTTPEEFYEQVKAILAKHPVNDNGETVYALSDYGGGSSILPTLQEAWGFIEGVKPDEDGSLVHWLFTDEGEELCKYINRFWREGMIDPDFVTNSFDDWKAKGVNERLVADLGTWWRNFVMGHEYWQQANPDTPIEKRYLNTQVTAEGVEQNTLANKNLLCTDVTNGAYWILTDACEDPAAVMKYLNWEWSPYGTLVVQYSYPAEDNVYNIIDGKIVFKDDALDASKKNEAWHGVKTDRCLYWLTTRRSFVDKGVNKLPFEIDERVIWDNWGTGDLYPKTPDGSRYLDDGWEISWGDYDMTTAVDVTMYNYILNSEDYEFTVAQNVRDLESTYWINIITADSEEGCLEMIKEARAALEGADIQILMDYRTEAYKSNVEKVFGDK